MFEINGLYFSYNKVPPYILKDINLNVKKGEYISILGDNGSGKTTLLKLLLGFLTPTKGVIKSSSKNIGYVPQKPEGINSGFPITVYEFLTLQKKALKIKDDSLIDTLLNKFNAFTLKNDLMENLSGGQRQKILIIRALMGNPDVLILDEPSTGVDVNSQKEIYSLIKDLNLKENMTVISIEHNLNAALYFSSHIFNISDGSGKLYTLKEFLNLKDWGINTDVFL